MDADIWRIIYAKDTKIDPGFVIKIFLLIILIKRFLMLNLADLNLKNEFKTKNI
jgi:hypothetical protein